MVVREGRAEGGVLVKRREAGDCHQKNTRDCASGAGASAHGREDAPGAQQGAGVGRGKAGWDA